MILSYHPCFESDKNLLCAGREPGTDDLDAIRTADAVILPQGCYESLYEMARNNCKHVFPNFDARFKYKGKIGQIQLFRKKNAAHPKTETYININAFSLNYGGMPPKPAFDFPFVFKFDWGGEGDHVFLIKSPEDFLTVMQTARKFEKSGQKGFIIQEYIPSKNRSLRVVIVGQTIISYWRIQRNKENFTSNIARGASIDFDTDPELQKEAVKSVKDFCLRTEIDLAGFDILFSSGTTINTPLFLEINYFFGRRGLGGSEKFYEILNREIVKWLDRIGFSKNTHK
jgi:ribosomal protein S6--L-glutamate ligase